MKRLFLLLLTLVSTFLALEAPARAEAAATSFALVVTNNRSTRLSRPDLRYADDDGAKYYELFRMLAPEANVALLTTFDRDTARLFPGLATKERAPSKANVLATARDLAEKIRAAKAAGPVDFYFVYAGHGDIEAGKGFLELSDGAFTSDDLEALLRSVPATRAHVILDSCNSFFVINSRKPGGKHFVTSAEATKSLSERLPNVGVFLSTSAEAEVFEWSELQSGVFSHAVRSGIAGAADANGDGRVSYDELRAFVGVATKDVKNPNYRPQVFARGPGGRGPDVLVDLTHADAKRLRLDEPRRRITVRDANELPIVDLHKEAGRGLSLRLPARVAAGANVEETDANGALVRRYALRSEESDRSRETLLASLPAGAEPARPRGADDMFRSLFAQPFGPEAFRQEQAEEATREPLVLGVSADDRERMRLLLREAAGGGRRTRLVGVASNLTVGLGFAVTGGFILERGLRREDRSGIISGLSGLAVGTWFTALGVRNFLRASYEEETYRRFTENLSVAPDTIKAQNATAEAERRLLWAADRDHRSRVGILRWLTAATFAGAAAVVTYRFVDAGGDVGRIDDRLSTVVIGALGLYSGVTFVDSFFPPTAERMAELWRSDPSQLRNPRPTGLRVAPTFGLGNVGLQGTF